MRKQYHFWPGEHGLDAWDVDRLIRLSSDLPVIRVPLDSITEADSVFWFNGERELPTVRAIVEHMRLVEEVNLSYPVILGFDGRVMDGMHRIARALLDGHSTIAAVRLERHPEPDCKNASPTICPTEPHATPCGSGKSLSLDTYRATPNALNRLPCGADGGYRGSPGGLAD